MFMLLLFDLLDCSWSDLLFISAMIKPFEFIKVLVSSVCTVPNARNTRRSTALGETPLIWYCARYPEPSNHSVSVGCGCRDAERKCAVLCDSLVQFDACAVQQLLLPLCSFPNSFSWVGGLGGIQVLRRGQGGGGQGLWSSKVFCCNQQQSKKLNKKRNLLPWTSSMDGRKVYGVYCTM